MKHYKLSNGEIVSSFESYTYIIFNNKQITEITFEEAFKDELQKYVSKKHFDILQSDYDLLSSKYQKLDSAYDKLYREGGSSMILRNKISSLEQSNKKLQSENANLRNAIVDCVLNFREGQQ